MRLFALVVLLLAGHVLFGQKAVIKESKELFRTYGFGDPSPVARVNKVYPYFRFDGFTNTPKDKEWTIVTLENDYIKVLVAPEVGGKVLGAIDKSTGEEFIYYNKVMKFRDIAMRGPWTSGGIEFNFGTIGHAPSTASPVNYILEENEDGSVSCIVGAPDLTSRTEWRVEIRLHPDRSYFETNAIWYNPYDLKTSLYNWMTASVDATDDLEYHFPGTRQIGHGGEAFSWPVNENGVDISLYKNNNFGGDKSYHVTGEYAEHFLCYFRNKDFGLGHWAAHDDKPGKKIWMWAISRQGAIWTDLLTDPGNVQYSEIQTGLLYNQAGAHSTLTPYKHMFFDEGTEHKFSELWFPVKEIGGMVKANEYGSLNVEQNGREVKVGFCANQEIVDNLIVKVNDKVVVERKINLKPTEVVLESFEMDNINDIQVEIGNYFSYDTKERKEQKLSRPAEMSKDFDWKSTDAVFTAGIELERQRDYNGAKVKYEEVLQKDPFHTGALTGMANLHYRSMLYEEAETFAYKALSNNTYDPGANYIYGLVSKKLGKKYDALEAFGLAARSMQYRSVAKTQMATVYFASGDMSKSLKYVNQALEYNRNNINALKVKALVYEAMGQQEDKTEILNEILTIDPLNTFARFEKNYAFEKVLHFEMPFEICLEQAIAYYQLNLEEKAVRMLQSTKPTPIIYYWLAYILKDSKYLEKAVMASPELVYPFREETAEVLQWALMHNNSWKTKYYLGLIYWSKGRVDEAKKYFAECGNEPDYFAFYLTRDKLNANVPDYDGEADLKRAWELDKNEWRTYQELSYYYEQQSRFDEAFEWIEKGASKFPDNFVLSYQYAGNLLIAGKYADALDLLKNTTILPSEGASSGRYTYWKACILDAVEKLKKNKDALALINQSRDWPENLGAGKPYNADERISDYLESIYWAKKKNTAKAEELKQKVIQYTRNNEHFNSIMYLGAVLLKESGNEKEGRKWLMKWVEKAPQNLFARWSLSKYSGDEKEAEKILLKIKEETKGSLLGTWSRDPAFPLVLAVLEME